MYTWNRLIAGCHRGGDLQDWVKGGERINPKTYRENTETQTTVL